MKFTDYQKEYLEDFSTAYERLPEPMNAVDISIEVEKQHIPEFVPEELDEFIQRVADENNLTDTQVVKLLKLLKKDKFKRIQF